MGLRVLAFSCTYQPKEIITNLLTPRFYIITECIARLSIEIYVDSTSTDLGSGKNYAVR